MKLSIISKCCINVSAILLWCVGLLQLIDYSDYVNSLNGSLTNADLSSIGIVFNISTLKGFLVIGWIVYVLIIILLLFLFSTTFTEKLKTINNIGYIALGVILLMTSITAIVAAGTSKKTIDNVTSLLQQEMAEEIMASVLIIFSSLFSTVINIFLMALGVALILYLNKLFSFGKLNENEFNFLQTKQDSAKNDSINMELKYQKLIKKKINETEVKIKTIELEKEFEEKVKRLKVLEEEAKK